jgi:hypothetical protein
LNTRVGAGPGGQGDAVPQLLRLDADAQSAVHAADELPIPPLDYPAHELGAQAHGIVRGLAAHGIVGLLIPFGGVLIDGQVAHPLAQKLQDAVQVAGRHLVGKGRADRLAQSGVGLGVEALGPRLCRRRALQGGRVPRQDAAAGDHGHDLPLLLRLPVHVLQDVRVVRIQGDHARRAASGASALDRGGGTVAYFQEGEQAGGDAPAAQRLGAGTEARVVGPRAGAVLEQAGFAGDQVHDPAFVDQVVLHREDETVMH